jgi:hypothetical protein
MKIIYKRPYLKLPHYLELDAGTEFKDQFEKFFKTKLNLRVKEPGRHRQQSVVETRNALISRTLNKRMVGQEINTGEKSTEWVNFLPKVIASINNHYTSSPQHIDGNEPIRGSKDTLNIIPKGTQVRIALDNPADHLTKHRLNGSWRQGDIRWTKQAKPITQIYLRPSNPPLYKVGENENVAFTKNQLQVVKTGEVQPSSNLQEKFTVEKLMERFKKGSKVYFKVKWSDGSTTDEPRTNLIKDVPQLVKEFEKK